MSILSVEEDFASNTLAAIPGLWEKLRYVSSLRQEDGRYEHWGLARKYGQEAAARAIGAAHRELAFEVLRTPLSELVSETRQAAERSGVTNREFVDTLAEQVDALAPQELQASAGRHFRTVVKGLSFLVQDCRDASRRAS